MKKLLLFLLIFQAGFNSFSQSNDTIPPYLQVPIIPPFKILLTDSTWYTKADLTSKKPLWLLYFSPDCGHCQLETETIISNMNKLKKVQIVMITSRPFEDMKDFSAHYLLDRFPNIKIGSDPSRFISNFYKVEFTPFSAVYNKKGNLVKAYKKGADLEEVIQLTK